MILTEDDVLERMLKEVVTNLMRDPDWLPSRAFSNSYFGVVRHRDGE